MTRCKKEIFYNKGGKHWNKLLMEVVEAPSLETFKARLDGALSNLVSLKIFCLLQGVGLDDL